MQKHARQEAVTQVISEAPLRSQHELARRLRRRGFAATQATLSRDLAELGVVKGAAGYMLPGAEAPAARGSRFHQALARLLLRGACAGNLVILHTAPGQANALAVELDRARLDGVVGTISGDDCIFVATGSPANARSLLARLKEESGSGR